MSGLVFFLYFSPALLSSSLLEVKNKVRLPRDRRGKEEGEGERRVIAYVNFLVSCAADISVPLHAEIKALQRQ